jgi:uncharacterized protein
MKNKEELKIVERVIKRLKKEDKKNIDTLFNEAHETVFAATNCLTCANCCKTTSPIFKSKEIDLIAKKQKTKSSVLFQTYFKIDTDGDIVLKKSPCLFLDEDNYCSIYAYRPQACSDYPHTQRKNMQSILNLTAKNAEVCPAVLNIFKKINTL